MRSSMRERWTAWKYSVELTLAPHVEGLWAEELLVELRLQGVSGTMIGEALTEVESHCAESGERAEDAFGDATGYARSLGLPRSPDESATAVAAAVIPVVVQLVGMYATTDAFDAWVAGDELGFTTGMVLSTAIMLGVIASAVVFTERVLRFIVAHPVFAYFLSMAIVGMYTLVTVLGRHVLVAVPAVPVLIVSAGVLVAGAAWQRTRSRSGVDDDPVTSPLAHLAPDTGQTPGDETAPGSRMTKSRVGEALLAHAYLMTPAYTAVILVLTWGLTPR
ncbi:hypothetical protein [Sanguibacter antarcticus]|uniref:Uncharacterized protein n=1 Tax=Sanguibacter antarcticus TaxID=372484 RepID=A0A2A9EA76_9MICO|nr:hypothetical protein [Sanguibacter antarcticus]PFG35165.1 hypothetical protein ATL42_3103 [Sanguibacter antarcticus]